MHTMSRPLVTVAIPCLNHGRFLDDALTSIFQQEVPVEVFVLDAGSSDNTTEVIAKWASRLAAWRSAPDSGQSAAINEGVKQGSAPYVCWLNADDFFLAGGLAQLVEAIESEPRTSFSFGRCWSVTKNRRPFWPYPTCSFTPAIFANFCTICQPGTIIRRSAWEDVRGLDEKLHMAMDYDLWWRLYIASGKPAYLRRFVAATRSHDATKTAQHRRAHYTEAKAVVAQHYGAVPIKWELSWPVMVSLREKLHRFLS